jgi:hypothetical protein
MIDRDSDVIISDSEYRALERHDLPEEIERQSAKLNGDTLAGQMLDAVPDPYIAVNRRLQVLFANEAPATDHGSSSLLTRHWCAASSATWSRTRSRHLNLA